MEQEGMDPIVECTDLGNALRLEEAFGDRLRYSLAAGWHFWEGRKWDPSPLDAKWVGSQLGELILLEARALSMKLHEQKAKEDDPRWERVSKIASWAQRSMSAGKISAALDILSAQPLIRADPGVWDRQKELLNVRNGVLDLETLELREHASPLMLTKLAGVGWDPELGNPKATWVPEECPRFWQFLLEIFQQNLGIIQSVQQALGYSLTGWTGERCIFLCYGTGANGKSTLLNLIKAVLGDYAGVVPPTTLTVRKMDEGRGDDLASLQGKRMVLAQETEGGARLAEALVKRLTGGDPISCRRLYHDWFEYTPEFKIWLATNHKPVLTHTDPSIRARIRLLPFQVEIPREQWDVRLNEKLLQEGPGILRWLVKGVQELQEQDMAISWDRSVVDATENYFSEQDVLGQFIDEALEYGPSATLRTRDAYDAYLQWIKPTGHEPLALRNFSIRMSERRGIEKVMIHGISHFRGVQKYAGFSSDISF